MWGIDARLAAASSDSQGGFHHVSTNDVSAIFVAYLIFVTFVAWWSGRKTSGGAADVDYYLGGHSTPIVVLAFSYVTSSVSATAFMGDPGIMSRIGWPYYWIVIAIIPSLILPAVLLMQRLRQQAELLAL